MARKASTRQVDLGESQAEQPSDAETAVATAPAPGAIRPIVYDITEAEIATLATRYGGLSVERDYEGVREAVADLRGKRVAVDERRKELNADALEHQRKVNARAKHLTALIEAIEEPLRLAKKSVDDAKARQKWEEENAARLAEEEKARQERAAEEARRKTEREAEERRLAEQRAAQDAKDKELREAQAALDAEKEKVAAAQRKIDAANQAAAEAAARERKEQEDRDRAARVERERLEREQAEREKAARMAPDAEKLRVFAAAIRAVVTDQAPELASPEGGEAYDRAAGMIMDAVEALEMFGAKRSGR